MKGYYIYGDLYDDEGNLKAPGVKKKILAQMGQMAQIGEIREVVVKRKPGTAYNKITKRIPIGSHMNEWEKAEDEIRDPDYLYIRKEIVDQGMIRFLKRMKEANPKVVILLEMPTYPYDKEKFFSEAKTVPLFLNDAIYRKKLRKYIDRIVVFSRDKEVFGIPTIRIRNGIDITQCPVRKTKKDNQCIRLIAVAAFQKSHGYERIIEGLNDYVQAGKGRKVELHLVGEGNELPYYRSLVDKLHLGEYVLIRGMKTGAELDKEYDEADIGLEAFGFYKRGISLSSSLKSREYLARGLPFISGCENDLIGEQNADYYLQFSNDHSKNQA